jgi:hypothetical protein
MIKLAVRSLAIMAIFTGISLFYGCPGDGIEVPININLATIAVADNTEESPYATDNNHQPSEAIAYKVNLYDTTIYNPYWAQSRVTPISTIQSAYAWSYNEIYILENKVESIRIFTLEDFSDDIRANDEVTHLFVAELDSYEKTNILYYSMAQIVDQLNSFELNWNPHMSFYLFLKQEPTGNTITFEVRLQFVNGQNITAQTPRINVIQ